MATVTYHNKAGFTSIGDVKFIRDHGYLELVSGIVVKDIGEELKRYKRTRVHDLYADGIYYMEIVPGELIETTLKKIFDFHEAKMELIDEHHP